MTALIKSLHQYLLQKENKVAFRFDMNPASKQLKTAFIRLSGTQKKTERLDYEIISLPLYAVEAIPRLCKELEIV